MFFAFSEKLTFFLSRKFETHDPKNPIAFFMDIQTCLNLACDQLLMLDCSFSEQAFAAKEKGKRRSELLTSTNYNGICPPPGRDDSFTRILVDAMKRLLNEYPDGFSTSRLYREIYQATRRSRSQPMLFYESRHDYSTIWLRPQAF